MNLIYTTQLTDRQKQDMVRLAAACREKEPLSLSAPTDDGLDYFLCLEGTELIGFAALFFPEETLCECTAFVAPSMRRKGVFLNLLDQAIACTETREKNLGRQIDFCFLVDERTPSAMACLEAIEGEYWYSEYKMVRKLTEKDRFYEGKLKIRDMGNQLYAAVLEEEIIGTCALLPSEHETYLYGFQIKETYQGQGYGKDFLRSMLAFLTGQNGPDKVSLQVSGQNYIARNLYKKTGFRTVESLSYYLY